MEKLLDTINNSCKELKSKGILTDDEYQKCNNISENEPLDDIRNKENEKYLDKVYNTPNDKITESENNVYNKYKRMFDSNIDNFKKAYHTKDKNLQYRYRKNLEQLIKEIKELIDNYEEKIKNTKSQDIYKEMILKNKQMNNMLTKIVQQNNDLYTIKKKKDNIKDKIYKNRSIIKNNIIIFIFFLLIILFLILEMKYKM